MRPSPSLPVAYTSLRTMNLECGFLCEGLGSDFLRQSKERDCVHVLDCHVSGPLSTLLTESNTG